MSDFIQIKEMGPRDGLQNEKQIIATTDKLKLIEGLIKAGVSYIEATAFVSPKAIPQMADASDVARSLKRLPNVTYSVLVPNLKGFDAALSAYDFQEIAVFTAASETFNQKNINASIAESFDRFHPVIEKARQKNIRVRGYVSTAFVCPYEGKILPKQVLPVVERLFDMGCYEVSIGDTIGKAVPENVDALFEKCNQKKWIHNLAGHFHDTYGFAISNVIASMKWGVSTFDTSVGGMGGCPYAPGAAGNLATDDLVFYLHQIGKSTGIDLQELTRVSTFVRSLLNHELPSKAHQALISKS